MGFSFIHAADLHLGKPLGLRSVPNFLEESAKRIDEQLLKMLVECCCAKDADFLLLCGDVFDDARPSLKLQRSFQRAMTDLHQADVQVYIIEGNHDAGVWEHFSFSLPSSVHCFGTVLESVAQTVDDWRVEIWGINFQPDTRRQSQIELFPRSCRADWSTVMLHAEQGESGEYHPLLHRQLYDSPFAYHALGHEHSFQYRTQPHMVYPGVPQGRGWKETGEKGVCLVTVNERETHAELLPLNALQWLQLPVDVTAKDRGAVWHELIERSQKAAGSVEALLLIEAVLHGSSDLHGEFMDMGFRNELLESWQEECLHRKTMWVDGVTYCGEPAICFQKAAEQDDFFGEVLRRISAAGVRDEIRRLESRLGVSVSEQQVKDDARRLAAVFLTDDSTGVDYDVD